MAEYIEREITCFDDCFYNPICIFRIKGDEWKRCVHFKNKADVVEVRHGEWVDRYGNKYDNHLYDCSVCHAEALLTTVYDALGTAKIVQDLSIYCPNCGAKMDGKGDSE